LKASLPFIDPEERLLLCDVVFFLRLIIEGNFEGSSFSEKQVLLCGLFGEKDVLCIEGLHAETEFVGERAEEFVDGGWLERIPALEEEFDPTPKTADY
jgi:hypothetical protein